MSEKRKSLTITEVLEEYNIAKSTFYTKAKALGIEGELPSGRQRGARFAIKDVEKIVESLGITPSRSAGKKDKQRMMFRRARPEDAQQMHELGKNIMERSGGYGVPTKILLPFLSIPNSEIGHVLVRDEQIIGYITLVPLTHEQIIHVMRRDEESLFHQIRIRDVQPEELARFEPGTPIDIFIWELMSDPEHKKIGQYLLNKMFAFFHALGRRGVDIQGIYATATSREGINLCQRIGMQVMDLPEVIQPNWIPFEWKIQEKRTWLTKNYIQAIKSYRKRQQRMEQEADTPASFEDA